jgi:hypothetical protein
VLRFFFCAWIRLAVAAGSPMKALEPTLGQLAGVVAWLRHRGVDGRRLAAAFQTNQSYIRVLAHRGRTLADSEGIESADTDKDSRRILAHMQARGVGPEDTVVLTNAQRRNVEALTLDVDRIRREAEATGDFRTGVDQLVRMSMFLGRPQSVDLVRLRARLRWHTSWCLVHSGFSRSAAVAAWRAMADFRYCFSQAEHPSDIQMLQTVGLVASLAQLLRRRPSRARQFLNVVDGVTRNARGPLPADYYRQQGMASFQLGDDEGARRLLAQGALALAEQEPHRKTLDIRFSEFRLTLCQRAIDWDRTTELLNEIQMAFGRGSLKASMMAHWTAAAGFSTDSPRIHQECADLLRENSAVASRFGHQATLSRLLRLTPDLRLPDDLRRVWLRHAMYANVFSRR